MHLTVEAILEYVEEGVEGRSDEARQAQARNHIAECEQCRVQAEEFRELTRFLAADAGNEPPADILRQAIDSFQPVLRPQESGTSRLLRIAQRVFDSFDQPVVGVRSMSEIPRQLLYRSGEIDVDLRIESEGGQVSVAGQLLSHTESFPANTPVRLEADGAVRFSTATNAVGEFSFEAVPDATYHIALELPEGDLRLFCVNQAASA